MEPIMIRGVFSDEVFEKITEFAALKRKQFEGTDYHDKDEVQWKMNRWRSHNDEMLVSLHKSMAPIASVIFKEQVKPSYVFLSMYGNEGIVPVHTDRPMCKYTIDLCIAQEKPWEIYVDDKPYLLAPGDSLCYSGTDSPHYRNRIQPDNWATLAFFHFVPVSYQGELD